MKLIHLTLFSNIGFKMALTSAYTLGLYSAMVNLRISENCPLHACIKEAHSVSSISFTKILQQWLTIFVLLLYSNLLCI